MARIHIISNAQASAITLANSTAIGPKAMRYSNGFMRNVTAQATSTSTILDARKTASSPVVFRYGPGTQQPFQRKTGVNYLTQPSHNCVVTLMAGKWAKEHWGRNE